MFKKLKTILFILFCLSYLVFVQIYIQYQREIPLWLAFAITCAYFIVWCYDEVKREQITNKLAKRIMIGAPIVGCCGFIIYGIVTKILS